VGAEFSGVETTGDNGPLASARCTALVNAPDKNGLGRASTTLGYSSAVRINSLKCPDIINTGIRAVNSFASNWRQI
jgi:hypothetical protein